MAGILYQHPPVGLLSEPEQPQGLLGAAYANPLLARQVAAQRAANPRPDVTDLFGYGPTWQSYMANMASNLRSQTPQLTDSPEAMVQKAMGMLGNFGGFGITKPTTFFRGTNPGDARRIRTGSDEWDSYLFAASNEDAAKMYGRSIEKIQAKPDAKILYEGTRDFQSIAKGMKPREMSMLDWAKEVASRAKSAGYDAVHFKRQGDIGTSIFNQDKFIRNAE